MESKQIYDNTNNEFNRQKYYIEKIREINDAELDKTGIRPKMFIRTYGCQMNERDSEKITATLGQMGYEHAQSEKEADFVIYNTCCIRENAENKILGNLGRLKYYRKTNASLRVALCGCMVQQDGAIDVIKRKYKNVDILFGTFNFHRLPELLHTNIITGKPVYDIWDTHGDIVEDLPAERKYKWKTGINIMYGCDNYCAYCIVPYVRGRERSREPADIVREAESLAKDGVKEILLLGQNVNSYGKNLSLSTTFAELLKMVSDVEGIERIRFMTPHPKDFSDELIDVISKRDNILNHIHLPMQSGSSSVLSKMNRKYTKEHYLALVDKIKEKIPSAAITTDIIVGFPGETEQDFADTLDTVKNVRFSGAFTFIYSKRNGTPASKMEQANEETIKERFQRLLDVQNNITEEINDSYAGKSVRVLVDEISQKEGGIVTGRSEHNAIVHFNGGENLLGNIVDVKVTNGRGFFLEGVLEEKNDSI